MKLSDAFSSLLRGKNLSETSAQKIFTELLNGNIPDLKAKSLLLLLAAKGETADEIIGCLKALRALEPGYRTRISPLVDTCGTGGGNQTLNISTLAALVIAGAGVKVAKHGNRGLSSKCGSSDLLEKFGVNLNAPARVMLRSIQKNNLGYFHAPYHHPIFSRLQPLRRTLKTRTIFNLLGPLTNPVRPTHQLIGVARENDFLLYIKILKRLNATALVCHSFGLDEISTAAVTKIAFIKKGNVRQFLLHPKSYGFKPASTRHFKGGDSSYNRKVSERLLKGKLKGPVRDIVLLNAAAGLWISSKAKNLNQGIRLAEKSLDSGMAYKTLVDLKKISNQKGSDPKNPNGVRPPLKLL